MHRSARLTSRRIAPPDVKPTRINHPNRRHHNRQDLHPEEHPLAERCLRFHHQFVQISPSPAIGYSPFASKGAVFFRVIFSWLCASVLILRFPSQRKYATNERVARSTFTTSDGDFELSRCILVFNPKLLLRNNRSGVSIIRRIIVAAELPDRERRPRRRSHFPEWRIRIVSSHSRHDVRPLSPTLHSSVPLVIVRMPRKKHMRMRIHCRAGETRINLLQHLRTRPVPSHYLRWMVGCPRALLRCLVYASP
jgi:hypothetical protein